MNNSINQKKIIVNSLFKFIQNSDYLRSINVSFAIVAPTRQKYDTITFIAHIL